MDQDRDHDSGVPIPRTRITPWHYKTNAENKHQKWWASRCLENKTQVFRNSKSAKNAYSKSFNDKIGNDKTV